MDILGLIRCNALTRGGLVGQLLGCMEQKKGPGNNDGDHAVSFAINLTTSLMTRFLCKKISLDLEKSNMLLDSGANWNPVRAPKGSGFRVSQGPGLRWPANLLVHH